MSLKRVKHDFRQENELEWLLIFRCSAPCFSLPARFYKYLGALHLKMYQHFIVLTHFPKNNLQEIIVQIFRGAEHRLYLLGYDIQITVRCGAPKYLFPINNSIKEIKHIFIFELNFVFLQNFQIFFPE